MPYTNATQTVYGMKMPVQIYRLAWSCGHSSIVRIASGSPIPPRVEMPHLCPDCYTGPYGNVYD